MSTIYIHWPFCLSKCHYCDFNSVVLPPRIEYTEWLSLYKKILLRFKEIYYKSEEITSIYFGGGTPSLLPSWFITELLDTIHTHFRVNNPEITLEANPKCNPFGNTGINRPLSKPSESELLERKTAHRPAVYLSVHEESSTGLTNQEADYGEFGKGANRLSIGVQSIIDDDLTMLGRIHTASEAQEFVFEMSEIFPNISVDLIYNRPNQKPAQWIQELETVLKWPIQHISLYELIIEEGTRMKNMIDSGELAHPDCSSIFLEETIDTAERAGFNCYEVSNFARPGFECRHNISYWKYEDYYGVGPGAHSRISVNRPLPKPSESDLMEGEPARRTGVYFGVHEDLSTGSTKQKTGYGEFGKRSNGRKLAIAQTPDVHRWLEWASGDAVFDVEYLSIEEEFQERLIMGLRSSVGLNMEEIDLGIRETHSINNKIQSLLKNSYIMLRDGRVILTREGILKLNLIVEYLSGE
ncbi:MAG: hypothetical protein LBJ92_01170 [Holosporales bacterium]|jgi:coproporphyrinogen III oxidase-like Fe-S oxidoreductase|nr:hypothetical protein [Holosporales bacterium]